MPCRGYDKQSPNGSTFQNKTPGCLQRSGRRVLQAKAWLGFHTLSPRCTFDIISLSGTLLMAEGVVLYLFCLAQLLAPCGSRAAAESVSVCQRCSQVVWLLIWLTFSLNSVGWLKPSQYRSLQNNQLIAWARGVEAGESRIDWYSAVRKVTWLQDRAERSPANTALKKKAGACQGKRHDKHTPVFELQRPVGQTLLLFLHFAEGRS